MQFGGLVGEFTVDGPALPAVWPALWLGQWIHVGKGTAFGLGGYRVGAAANDAGAEGKLAKHRSGDAPEQTIPSHGYTHDTR